MEKFQKIFEQYFNVVSQSGDELHAHCPWHGDSSPSLSANIKKGVFICYGCGAKGTVLSLTEESEEYWSNPDEMLDLLDAQIQNIKTPEHPPPMPTFLSEAALTRFNFPHPYWKSRGFDEEVCTRFNLGYDPITRRLTIPTRNEHSQILGIIFRRTNEIGPKYKYPYGFSRSRNLFGSWIRPRNRTAVLTEGPLDTVRIWQAGYFALAIYGSTISENQIHLLHRLGIERILTFYDNDTAGRSATEKTKSLIHDLEVIEIKWRWKHFGKDPGSLSIPAIENYLGGYF
jgi:DNA primase